jgi:hypothetical protein
MNEQFTVFSSVIDLSLKKRLGLFPSKKIASLVVGTHEIKNNEILRREFGPTIKMPEVIKLTPSKSQVKKLGDISVGDYVGLSMKYEKPKNKGGSHSLYYELSGETKKEDIRFI